MTFKINIKPVTERYRAWACLTTTDTRKDLSKRQFCWITVARGTDGNSKLTWDRELNLTAIASGTAIVTFFKGPRGRSWLFWWDGECNGIFVAKLGSVIVKPDRKKL